MKILIYTIITIYFIGSIIEIEVHTLCNTAYNILTKFVSIMTMVLCCIWLEIMSEV